MANIPPKLQDEHGENAPGKLVRSSSSEIENPNMRMEPEGGPKKDLHTHTGEHSEYAPRKPVQSMSSDLKQPNMSLRTMVLVGKTGTGKSSSGNTILGRNAFKSATSSTSVTGECRKETGEVAGREIIMVDTPGLFDTDLSAEELTEELSKCINMTAPGPHAIILTIELGPFTKEDLQTVQKIRAFFGKEADKYTIILFTHGDELKGGMGIDGYVKRQANDELRQVIQQCGKRYHVFDNNKMNNRLQVVDFLDKVEEMVVCNGGKCYTNSVYKDVEIMLREKEEELRKDHKKNLEEQKLKLESKFRGEKRKLENLKVSGEEKERKSKELELLDERKNRVMTEYERYYNEKIIESRQEAEQTVFPETVLEEMANLSI